MVLQYLIETESPSNHTISGVRFWPIEGGPVISMPDAGSWLTSLNEPNEQLWSVALQLFEAVAFMHEHNVARMDLKPRNVVILEEGELLSAIPVSQSSSTSTLPPPISGSHRPTAPAPHVRRKTDMIPLNQPRPRHNLNISLLHIPETPLFREPYIQTRCLLEGSR